MNAARDLPILQVQGQAVKVLFPASDRPGHARGVQVAVPAQPDSRMDVLQILVNGLLLGALYACIAVGFSLVWGVLNVINMLHGSLIVLGGYLAFFAWRDLGLHPLVSLVGIAALLFALGWVLQYGLINRVVSRPVLTTLTLTFGLDMIVYNFMTLAVLGNAATGRPRHGRAARLRRRRASRSRRRHGRWRWR